MTIAKLPERWRSHQSPGRSLAMLARTSLWAFLLAPAMAAAQGESCTTSYHRTDTEAQETPHAVQLDSGALMIEFHAGARRRDFQILTPQAIASVRGTRWVMEVNVGGTSTLVIAGTVDMSRQKGHQTIAVGPGQGVDISPGETPIKVNRWRPERVRALLSRFGQ
jgi:hypothetical protein